MPSILDRVRDWLTGDLGPTVPTTDFLDELFARFPFAAGAQEWLRNAVRIEVQDRASLSGGGTWDPDRGLVRLYSGQYEAAIHELAHAVWEGRRRDRSLRDALVDAVLRLAKDPDPRWERVRALARHYAYGIAKQPGFERGMLLPEGEWGRGGGPLGEWNDEEMYAGLASGCMADLRLLPPYLRRFYDGFFDELPDDALSPEELAPHR
jgi:hypothetical protein